MKPIKLSEANADFFERVFEVVRLIPEGRATSYGAIANVLGAKRSSRMVGWAMNASHQKDGIPAHRVVNRNGVLTGKMHFNDPSEMERKLFAEGIVVKEDVIQNWKVVFWDPIEIMNDL
ncbi:MAG: MGMT family protein [Fluviicola sp.]|nr:MGMT family protein [Fluviicola sp.]